jgi:hypothetical protein
MCDGFSETNGYWRIIGGNYQKTVKVDDGR